MIHRVKCIDPSAHGSSGSLEYPAHWRSGWIEFLLTLVTYSMGFVLTGIPAHDR